MFSNYIRIALRNVANHQVLSAINILGLSIGLACFVLFQLYVVHEFSYDRFHEDAENIYRVYRWNHGINGQEPSGDVYLPMPAGPALKEEFPDIEEYVRMREDWGDEFIRIDGKIHRKGIAFADPAFFSVFNFPIMYGNHQSPLADVSSVVLTEHTAQELFGEANPVGRTLEIRTDGVFVPFTVTAVTKNIPSNSTISYDMLGSFDFMAKHTDFGKRCIDNWFRSSFYTFVKLREGSGLADDEHNNSRLIEFWKRHFPDTEAELRQRALWNRDGAPLSYGLQSIRAMHTDTRIGWGTDPRTIWTLLAIAAGVLFIACINFTTLSIGRSASRAREVGVRKVIGSTRRQLAFQFLTEAVLMAVISVALGMGLAKLVLPYFNELSGKTLAFSFTEFPEIIGLTAGVTILTGLIAGAYPALILSEFKPVEVLKSRVRLGGANLFTRSLVTLQFVLSIGLIAATIIILSQLNLMRTANPGFNKEHVIVVDAAGTDAGAIYPRLRQELQNAPTIVGIASAELGLGEGTGWSRSGFDYKGVHKEVYEYFIDSDYLDVLGMELLTGRNFDPAISSDTQSSVIINEAMMHDFGWTPDNVLGQELEGYYDDSTASMPVVIGVIKNFHFRPFTEDVQPQMFHQFADYTPYRFFIRTNGGDPGLAIKAIDHTWSATAPGYPLKYSFLDEDLDKFYLQEKRLSAIVGWAGGISIFLACMGIFGLAALAAANRAREIGIRKVCGASVIDITGLMSRGFIRLVAIALIVATPLTWSVMSNWLTDFAYHIRVPWWAFAISGAGAILIAFLTISIHSIRAASTSPVESLRSE